MRRRRRRKDKEEDGEEEEEEEKVGRGEEEVFRTSLSASFLSFLM